MIRVAPAGEMRDVLFNIKTILGTEENLVQNPEIIAAMRKWYEAHRQHVILPNGKVGIVTTSGNVSQADDFTYYDGVLGLTFSFNPFTYPFTQMGEIVSEEQLVVATSDLRESLKTEVATYIESSFRNGKCIFAVHQMADDQ
jgi:hypothetical protein